MNELNKQSILSMSKHAHDWTEHTYQQHPAVRGGEGWADKQRVLLADMALHLLQTALRDGELSEEMLKRNLYAILTISDQFIEGQDLKSMADALY
ncbi:hypothetical protein KSF73_09510 [Burkholderiaceae bacterium DAT-1]|nr:hypothetical protein [Burkholderiaceae bacterium DAT-1]